MSALNNISQKRIVFEYYRYQLVPRSTLQASIDPRLNSIEEIIKRKNEFFKEVLLRAEFRSTKGSLPKRHVLSDPDELFWILLSNRRRTHYTKDFRTIRIEDEPYVNILLDNNQDRQVIAVSKNFEAFQDTNQAVKIISNSIGNLLSKHYNLELHINPIVRKEYFWDIVKNQKVERVNFEIVKPNIPSMSESFTDDFRDLIENTNSHITKVELNGPKQGHLENIEESNSKIASLVDYSSEGGGNTKIKVKGRRDLYHTAQGIKKESIKFDIELESANPQIVESYIKAILDKA